MKLSLHRSNERGTAMHGWLNSRFSFSFGEYHNRDRMGFGALRVINDDIIEPGKGFGMHPHQDMEIITIVTKGTLEHKDSEGNHGITGEGHVQYMSAGSGVEHSEYNPSSSAQVELFQIWIYPYTKGLVPQYAQRDFRDLDTYNRWAFLVSSDGHEGSVPIRQDASIMMASLEAGHSLASQPLKPGHGRLLLVVEGEVETCGYTLNRRDELQVVGNELFEITAISDAKMLMFDVPMSW